MANQYTYKDGLAERFWLKVDKRGKDECWPWTAAKFHSGYGRIQVAGRAHGAHRISWELHNRPIPLGNGPLTTCVLHTCDRRDCVNPNHLFMGTYADNSQDMARKGRGGKSSTPGELAFSAKLSAAQVKEVLSHPEISNREFGRRFSVNNTSIRDIRVGNTWRCITTTYRAGAV